MEEIELSLNVPELVMLFTHGATACFNKNGQQICELQKSWFTIWLEWIESKGIDPLEIKSIEVIEHGRKAFLKPFRTEFGWNWEIVDV